MTSAQVNKGGGVCRQGDHVTAESFYSSAASEHCTQWRGGCTDDSLAGDE